MCVALITDLEFPASYKEAWIRCNSSLTLRSNICLAKVGTVFARYSRRPLFQSGKAALQMLRQVVRSVLSFTGSC